MEHTQSFPGDPDSRRSADDLSLVSSVSLMLSWIDSRLAELEERIIKVEKAHGNERMEALRADVDREAAKSDDLRRMYGELTAGQDASNRELKWLKDQITGLRQALVRLSDEDRNGEKARLEELHRVTGTLAAGQGALDRKLEGLKGEITGLGQALVRLSDEDRNGEKARLEELHRVTGTLAARLGAFEQELKELKSEVAGLRQAPTPPDVPPPEGLPREDDRDSPHPPVSGDGKGKAAEAESDKGRSILSRLAGFISRIGRGEDDRFAVLISRGDRFVAEGETGKATLEYEKALQLSPRSALAMTKLGKVHLAREELGKGLAALRTALEFDPAADDARIFLAGLLAHSNRGQKALDELARLAHPENYELDIIKATALFGMKRYHEVIDLLSKSADGGNGETARKLLARAHAAISPRQP